MEGRRGDRWTGGRTEGEGRNGERIGGWKVGQRRMERMKRR